VALKKATLLLIDIVRSIGCSLKIHRVESELLMETARIKPADRAISNMKFLIASKRIFKLSLEIQK